MNKLIPLLMILCLQCHAASTEDEQLQIPVYPMRRFVETDTPGYTSPPNQVVRTRMEDVRIGQLPRDPKYVICACICVGLAVFAVVDICYWIAHSTIGHWMGTRND